MASPLISVPWDTCLLEPSRDGELEAFARSRMGMVAPAVPYLATRPWIARALVSWNVDYGVLMHLDPELVGVVGLTVSQQNSCRFCYAATRWLLRMRGMSERRVQLLERQLATDALDARTVAAIRYGRALSRAAPLPGVEDRQRLLEAGFSREEQRELAFVVAFDEFANRLHTIIAVPPGRMERAGSWVWWWRPLALPMLRRFQKPGRPGPEAPSASGPYANLLRIYAGSPIEPVLRATVEDMSASTVLPPRVKALIFAVIARALNCEISAAEARAMLPPETSADELDRVLAHLGGPGSDPLESAVARFSRDSIWYSPLDVQRRARTLQRELSAEQFVETVGIASLANALCRLAAALAEP